ncbi:MAG: hypothetical protein QF828_11100, partial [Pseudomonadales bacterium]|nr:hypothetical protein [Pseudomonadales bacterium]
MSGFLSPTNAYRTVYRCVFGGKQSVWNKGICPELPEHIIEFSGFLLIIYLKQDFMTLLLNLFYQPTSEEPLIMVCLAT